MKNELTRALYWDLGIPRPPFRIEVHPTSRSNIREFRCWGNIDREEGGNEDVHPELLAKIVREGCELGVKEWVFTGSGEPLLLRNELTEIMQKIKSSMCYGELHTNGTMFSEPFVNDVVEMGWDRIVICLVSPEGDTNDEILDTEGAYSKIMDGLEMLQDIKDEVGSSFPVVDIFMPIIPQNFADVGNMMKFCKRKGIEKLVISTLDYNGAPDELLLDEDEMVRLRNDIPRLHALSRSLRMEVEIRPLENPFRPEPPESGDGKEDKKGKNQGEVEDNEEIRELDPRKVYCLEPFLSMVIRPTGGIGPCPVSWYDTEKEQENLSHRMLEKQALRDVWYGHFFSMLRENAKIGPPANYCSRCTPRLQSRQLELLDEMKLHRDKFMEQTLKQIIKEAEKDQEADDEIQKRLRRIGELKEEILDTEEELQKMRGFHMELEMIQSSRLYRLLRALRIIKE